MKLTTRLPLTARLLIESVSFRSLSALFLLGAISFTLGLGRASAAQLIWDPLNNGGNPPASGNWNTTAGNTVWYNGSSDVVWTQTSTTTPLNGATFGGADGTWAINIDAGQIAANNLTINNSGYTFSGNPIYLSSGSILSVAAGKTVTFNANFSGSSAQYWTLGSGATMNVAGNLSGAQYRLAGADATSTFSLSGANSSVNQLYILGQVNLTDGSLTTSSAGSIGYPNPQTINGVSYTTGTLTVSGSAVFTPNGNFLFVGRQFTSGSTSLGGQGTLILNGGTVNVGTATAKSLAICYDGGGSQTVNSGVESGTVIVNSGTLNVGTSSLVSPIYFFQTSCYSGERATMTQTGGTVNAWGGISFGSANTTYAGGVATLTQSGGTLYLGSSGIVQGSGFTAANNNTFNITLSGGTVGALANWSSSLPMTLGNANGNITFQCADNYGAPYNIALSGALIGAGGLNVTGGGTLTVSGANTYAGSTVLSNGTLVVMTASSPTNGPVTLDGSTGSPTLTLRSSTGRSWAIGTLTFSSGLPTVSFDFDALSPSTSVAPLLVSGNVAFAATPSVNITGTAIAVGTYPLIKYTGTISGAAPTSAILPGYISDGYVTNITATKTIALVVRSSTYNPALYWRVGDGAWDISSTANWTQFGSPVTYADGSAVIFDDSASGFSPITVTLNTTVNPLAVTANNSTKNYILTGTGGITGSGTLQLLGSGTMTLNTTNSYSGGTLINAGQLNINNGGDPITGTPIGLGPLTINAGAKLDNTSGSDVTLQATIPETWNGNFAYVGSANNFNTGPGQVTLNGNVSLAVSNHAFIVGGSIEDFGANRQLTKTGNGTLTLPVANFFSGGLTLFSGQLNFGDPYAAGSGVFTIYGGAIDNSSGVDFTLAPAAYLWAGSFSFLGSANLDLGYATVTIPNGLGNITLNVVTNTLTTEGDIVNNNTRVVKTGNGTWAISGPSSGLQSLGLLVSAGQVNLNKAGGQAIQGGNNVGLTVQVNALVLDQNSYQIHSASAVPIPVVLSGGTWDLNGWNENVDLLSIDNGGTLRNGAPASSSTLTTISSYTAMLSGTNCHFDVAAADGTLIFNGALGGPGSLIKTGAGVLNLNSNNTYTGDTTVSGGALALAYPSLANSSTVTVATNALLQLNFDATNRVAALVLNGVSQPAGLYNTASTPAYLAGPGSLQVGSALPTSPTNLTFSLSANTLFLSWPSNYVGWILQTNVVSLTAPADWHDVPGSQTSTQLAVPLSNPAVSNEFFRLRYPQP